MLSSVTNRLCKIRNKIHTNISHVQANKIQCERLAVRIDQLIDPLERLEHASSAFLREETRPLVDQFLQCLDDCNNYIERLTSPIQWWQEIPESDKFAEFNERLSQLGRDLSLGLNIQQLFDRKQDEEDKKEDLQNITEKMNQILQQQQEQSQHVDKLIYQRFESLRQHLTQNLPIVTKDERFLHIPYQDLHIGEKPIGSGGFADVYKGIWLTHHDQVAVKVLHIHNLSDDSQSDIRTDLYQEISIMHRIRYEHILTVLGVCIEPNFYAIIVEYMSLGSLYDILHGNNNNDQIIILSWSDRYSLAWQMAKSINYLHNLDPYILHRDIKSKNFLIKRNESNYQRFLLKLSDFGLAKSRRAGLSQSTSNQIVGSLAWKAPELLISHERHTKQSDVYSLAVTMWELASAKKPWDEYEDDSVISDLVKAGERPKIPLNVPESYKQAIEDAWSDDPLKRPTCFDLMERMCKQMKEDDQTIECLQVDISTNNDDSTKMSLPVMENNQDVTDQSDYRKIEETTTVTEIEFQIGLEHRTPSSTPTGKRLPRRSIIGEIITPSNADNRRSKRRQSIIKRDDTSTIIYTRF